MSSNKSCSPFNNATSLSSLSSTCMAGDHVCARSLCSKGRKCFPSWWEHFCALQDCAQCWETVLDDEEDGEGGAQLWWGRRPWDDSSGVEKGKTNPGPDLHFVFPNPLWADVPPCPELIPIPSELIDVNKEEIKTSHSNWKKNCHKEVRLWPKQYYALHLSQTRGGV